MRFISWNVNGLKACLNRGFMQFLERANADFFCIQETKLQSNHISIILENYRQYWVCSNKKGYSGTAIFAKRPAISVKYGFDVPVFDVEGRIITLKYDDFYLLNVYTPNAKSGMARLDFRMAWDEQFQKFVKELNKDKPIIICGDLNAVEPGIKSASVNKKNLLGFGDEECEKFADLLASSNLIDSFKHFNPTKKTVYTWRSYNKQKRAEDSGWRIDYFLISEYLLKYLQQSYILSDVNCSDHYPVALEINIS